MTQALLKFAKVAGVAVLLMLVWHLADGRAAVVLLQRADPFWLVAAVLALTLQTLLSAQRWRLTAGRLGLAFSLATALREYYLAQALNQFLPGGVLGDAGRAFRSRREAGLLVAGQAVVFERFSGQIGLLLLLVPGLALAPLLMPDTPLPAQQSFALIGAAALLALLGAGVFLTVSGPRDTALRRSLRAFVHAVAAREVLAPQAALSLGTALCNVAAFALCAIAVGVAVPGYAVALLAPFVLCAMVLPLSIGGWGLREGAAALLFPVIGATASEGLAASVAFGLVFLLATLPGLVLLCRRSNTYAVDRP